MNSWEDRLAAILPFTRSILAAACWKYSSFISMPIYLRPVRSAAAQVEADVTLYSNPGITLVCYQSVSGI